MRSSSYLNKWHSDYYYDYNDNKKSTIQINKKIKLKIKNHKKLEYKQTQINLEIITLTTLEIRLKCFSHKKYQIMCQGRGRHICPEQNPT